MAFTGYPTTALKFFTKLKKNNKREWFLAHKPQYEALLVEPSRHLVYDLNASRALKKLNLKCTEKYPLFRINRDLRFTTDKAPYKTHNGVLFSPSGTRKESGFLYVHLEPGGCMVALGFWHPDPKLLTGFRLWVAENPVAAKTLVKKLKLKKLTLDQSDSAKRMPRGFEHITDPLLQDLIKLKNWIVERPIKDSEMGTKKLISIVEKFSQDSAVLLNTMFPMYQEFQINNLNLSQEL